MNCQNCGYEIQSDWNLCPNCGVQLKEEINERIICKNCGKEIKGDWEKCHHCGVQLKGSKKIDFSQAKNFSKNLYRDLKDKLYAVVPTKFGTYVNDYYIWGTIIGVIIIIISVSIALMSFPAENNLWQKVYSGEGSSILSINSTNEGYLLGGAEGSNSYLTSIDQAGSQQWTKKQNNWGSIINIINKEEGYLIGFESGIITYVNQQGDQSILHDVKSKIMSLAHYQGQTIVLSPDGRLIKLNQSWEPDWIKSIPVELSSDLHMRINNLNHTKNGDILLALDKWVYKLTPAGKIIWEQGFDHHLYTIKEDKDGAIIAAGADNNYDDAWLIKLNQQGKELWQQNYNQAQESIFDLAISDDGYLLVGATQAENKDSDGYLIKVDQRGRVEWTKQYGGARSEIFAAAQAVNGEGYLAAGMSNSFGADLQTAYAVKINQRGEIIP